MTEQPYERPPITEAVIELKFAEAVDLREVDNLSRDFAERYPRVERLTNYEMMVGPQPAGEGPRVLTRTEFSGFKRTSEDALQILMFGQRQFLVARLAPYPGWGAFIEQFQREWMIWKRRADYKRISRVGVRYINRLDFPVVEGRVVDNEYLNLRVTSPEVLGDMLAAAWQVKLPALDLGCQVTINSGTVESPLPDHISFLLDIDIGTVDSGQIAQKDGDLFSFLDRVRQRKNMVFEACITDAARKLFGVVI